MVWAWMGDALEAVLVLASMRASMLVSWLSCSSSCPRAVSSGPRHLQGRRWRREKRGTAHLAQSGPQPSGASDGPLLCSVRPIVVVTSGLSLL